MNRIATILKDVFLFGTLICLLLSGCAENDSSKANTKASVDNEERSFNWDGKVTILIEMDSSGWNDVSHMKVRSFESSLPLNELGEQLIDMAFSGDARVYGPTMLGERDPSRLLDPRQLVEELQAFDTLTVTDLATGSPRDTVIDKSLNKSTFTAFIIRLASSGDPREGLEVSEIMMGRLVFNESTGELRGARPEFYMTNPRDEINEVVATELFFYSDSLANFQPTFMQTYRDEGMITLMDHLHKEYPESDVFKMSFRLRLSSGTGEVIVEEVEITPQHEAV